LQIRELPVPEAKDGWVVIEVKAFGLNRSELQTRLGFAGSAVTYPRVLGIEAAGVVAACPGGEFAAGQQVVAMMGGMGRQYDGGYAEYTCVPAAQVIPFASDLGWATIGAVPETLQTAYGSLTVGLDAQPGDTVLIRGGTSSIGMTMAVLAKQRDMTVFATTPRRGQGRRAAGDRGRRGADRRRPAGGAGVGAAARGCRPHARPDRRTHAARLAARDACARRRLQQRRAVQRLGAEGLLTRPATSPRASS
jgi:NADPH:quinone reductase-like Zn-dependent oxidoreductase